MNSKTKFLILAAAGAAGYYIYANTSPSQVGPAMPPTYSDLEKKLPKPGFEIPPYPGQERLRGPLSMMPIAPPRDSPVDRNSLKGPGQISPPFIAFDAPNKFALTFF